MATSTQMTLTAALKKHCSRTGESLQEFRDELKKLSPEDREWFKAQFEKELGISIIEPKTA